MKRTLLLLLFAGLLFSLVLAAYAESRGTVTILFTGDSRGWLKPCGCSGAAMSGGIVRRATVIDGQRSMQPDLILVDLGHNFKDGTRQERIKASTLLASLKLNAYDAVTFGKGDFMFGADLLLNRGPAPYVSANVKIDNQPQGLSVPFKLIRRGPRPVMIVGVTGTDVLYSGEQGSIEIDDPSAVVKQYVAEAEQMKPRPLVVVLAAADAATAQKLFDIPGVDVLIRSSNATPENADKPVFAVDGTRAWAETADQARLMGRITLDLDAQGRVTRAAVDYIMMSEDFAEHPVHKKLYDDYLEEVKQIFLESAAEEARHAEQSPYSGSESCMQCHKSDFEAWVESRHSRAMESLQRSGHAFDPECIACHSIGFGEPGGFISMDLSPGLGNVGCEACHGPRKEHASNPALKGTPADSQTCLRCHNSTRDPKFDYQVRWRNIVHGKPEAQAR